MFKNTEKNPSHCLGLKSRWIPFKSDHYPTIVPYYLIGFILIYIAGWWFFALPLWKMMVCEFVSWDDRDDFPFPISWKKCSAMFQTSNQISHQPLWKPLLTIINHWYPLISHWLILPNYYPMIQGSHLPFPCKKHEIRSPRLEDRTPALPPTCEILLTEAMGVTVFRWFLWL